MFVRRNWSTPSHWWKNISLTAIGHPYYHCLLNCISDAYFMSSSTQCSWPSKKGLRQANTLNMNIDPFYHHFSAIKIIVFHHTSWHLTAAIHIGAANTRNYKILSRKRFISSRNINWETNDNHYEKLASSAKINKKNSLFEFIRLR